MIENRVSLAKNLLNDGGFIFTSIDENEINNLAKVFDIILPHKVGIAVIQTNPKGRGQDRYLATSHDYLFIAAKSEKAEFLGLPKGDEQLSEYNQIDEHGSYRLLELRNTHRQFHRGNRPNLWYPLYVDPGSGSVSCTNQKYFIEVLPIWSDGFEGCWTWGRPLAEKNADLLVGRNVTGKWKIYRKDYANRNGDIATYIPKSVWAEKEMRTDYAQQVLDQTMGNRIFQSPKPTALIQRVIQLTTNHDEYMLDFFAGSGTSAHAVISLNILEATRRRYVLIEMANHFDSIILSRIKKVVYTLDWGDGKPQNANGISHFIKYQYLEQYEDALDNLELAPDKTAPKLFGDDYLLKYFLDFETKDNPSLLNIEHLKKPFSYKLKVNLEEVGEPQEVIVDIPETFHSLLGLKVNKVKVRKNKGKKYLFTLGSKDGRAIAIVWREYDDDWTQVDFKRDKDFIIEELGSWSPQIVYVNGQSVLTPTFGDQVVEIRSIEPEFKALMVNSL
jgi:adenine-specific DNA-methyltransferase